MTFTPVMTVEELSCFLEREFPQIQAGGKVFDVLSVEPGLAHMRMTPGEMHLRPGNTVSGPALFTLCDVAAYVTILAHIGPVALAVTTNLNINFLRKPGLDPLIGTCRILKLGKRLVVVEVTITPEGQDEPVAHAVATYSVPPR